MSETMKEPTQGIRITTVDRNGAAYHAGLEPGDVIIRYNGQPIRSVKDLDQAVQETTGLFKVNVEYQREGKVLNNSITTGKLGIHSNESGMDQSVAPAASVQRPQQPSIQQPRMFWTSLIMFMATLTLIISVLGGVMVLVSSQNAFGFFTGAQAILIGLFAYAIAKVMVETWKNTAAIRNILERQQL
ncbi:PDZ domain-containing protein [Marinobacter sp. AN1]|uniref:PDZ domain-containing protein n=1 Tax=Marinobacter sp. AN1 TaxID=2886046 RepID=UPI002230AFF4|nr:PDZ domain-containing protein [Marinobacter sp. AN1]UZD64647.1 PDZ domain-containing protein [Marinobacter sp. AN1]